MFRLILRLLYPIRRLLWLPFWHSVYYFLKKPRRILFLLAGLLGVMAFYNQHPSNQKVMIDTAGGTPEKFISEERLPEIRGKIADGNSVFAKSLMEQMEPADLQNYSGYFYHAMHWAPVGKPYQWNAYGRMFGKITAQAPYKSKSGVYCRRFNELLSYKGKHERFRGIACQRRAGGWCKLRPSSAHTCELGRPSSLELFLKNLF